jgi:hypothetical protein
MQNKKSNKKADKKCQSATDLDGLLKGEEIINQMKARVSERERIHTHTFSYV